MRKTYMLLVVTIIFSVMFLPVVMMSTQTQQRSQKVVIEVENGEQIDLYEGSYALLIGASDYTKGWKKLPGVKKDLEEIGKSLKKQGFEVEVALNPTSKEFDQVMKSFIRKYGRRANNRLIIYFAGHGETLRTADGRKQGYIVPVDAPTPNRDEAGFKELAINMGLIEIFARDIEAKHAMFVFDSCFSGTLFRGNEGRPPAMTSKAAKPVRQFITAGDESQTVPDESIFRQMFVRGLEGEADRDEDGYVTGSELGYFLETRVANYSNNSQTPRSGKIRNPDLDQGDFVFSLAKPTLAVRPKPKIEVEREIPLGTLIVIANRKDMEILVDKAVVAKSKAAGERITIKNVEAGRLIELVGRSKGEKDIIERIELIAGAKTEISLGKIVIGGANSATVSNTTTGNMPLLPVYRPAGTAVATLMKNYSYETVVLDGNGNVKSKSKGEANYYEEDLGRGIKLEMVEVAGGTFMMGSPSTEVNRYEDEGPQHKVRVATFYIGKYEVTQGQWKAIMGNNPSYFTRSDSFPAESISWEEAIEFCKKLSEKTGREYRLPSEAEWEYAARGGTTTAFGYGETINTNIANYNGEYPYREGIKGENRGKTVKVGSFVSNSYGLYDMHGNVWEWCQDIYQSDYKGAPEDGRAWEKPEAKNKLGVVRGGSCFDNAVNCRSANRGSNSLSSCSSHIGFRVAVSGEILK